jgi:NDP-sugar pyrophosphorylase family protein
MSDRAVVLAGGRGTRLQPYTVVLPKPLMPLGDCPILEILIRQLARYGFRRVTLAVNHQADIIRAFFGDGAKWKIQIDYSFESEPLSTIAPLRLIRDLPASRSIVYHCRDESPTARRLWRAECRYIGQPDRVQREARSELFGQHGYLRSE